MPENNLNMGFSSQGNESNNRCCNNGGILGNLGCGCNSEILFFIIIFLLLFTNFGCGCGCNG